METIRYDYKPKLWVIGLSGLFFAGCGVVLAKSALENDRGMIINGLITLDTGDASILLWVLTLFSVGFVLVALVGVVRALGAPQEVVLDARAITAPKSGFSRMLVTVPLLDVDNLQIVEIKSQKMLTIHHRHGKLTINRAMLPDREAFETLFATLRDRCTAVRRR